MQEQGTWLHFGTWEVTAVLSSNVLLNESKASRVIRSMHANRNPIHSKNYINKYARKWVCAGVFSTIQVFHSSQRSCKAFVWAVIMTAFAGLPKFQEDTSGNQRCCASSALGFVKSNSSLVWGSSLSQITNNKGMEKNIIHAFLFMRPR